MNALSSAASALPATLKKILAPSPRAKTSALGVSEQTGSLTFAKSNVVGVDASVRFSDLDLSSATTKLTVGLTLAAGQKYSFSFFFRTNGPKVTLIDGTGKSTAVNMTNGFTATKSGSYQLVFEAGYSLKDSANFGNLSINAKSVLPASSGDKNIDALLMGGTDEWWHPYNAGATSGTTKVSATANGLNDGSSVTTLTYSFLSSQPAGQIMTGFTAMTDAQKTAVRNAFAYYAKLIDVTFTEVAGDGTGNINFGTNTQTSSAGYANLPDASGAKDKVFLYLANNQTSNNEAGMAVGGYGWMTALHEIGHTLGLKHPGNYNAGGGGTPGPYLPASTDNRQFTIMSYHDNSVSSGVNATTAMPYDIEALQYLYGANTSASTATDGAFSFTAGNNFLQTLWSTNGTDQIDLSHLTNASSVDLNAGAYSSLNIVGAASSRVYSGNQNVALAYGSKLNRVKLSSTNGVAEKVALNNAFSSGAYDTIASFDATDDKIDLKKALFGTLTANNIEFATSATKSTSRIVVNRGTGEIFYDADGNGRLAAKKIAQYAAVAGRGELSVGNFEFVA